MFKITVKKNRQSARREPLLHPEWDEVIKTRINQANTAREQAQMALALQERAEQLDQQHQKVDRMLQQMRELLAQQKDIEQHQVATSVSQCHTASTQKFRWLWLKKKTVESPTLNPASPSICVAASEVSDSPHGTLTVQSNAESIEPVREDSLIEKEANLQSSADDASIVTEQPAKTKLAPLRAGWRKAATFFDAIRAQVKSFGKKRTAGAKEGISPVVTAGESRRMFLLTCHV
ncbi:hypothetical protein HDU78_005999 [Chytriomyces hyalinus]|nr:hypothetical protein HDU78_005999 [Chytriomyces hyalinus]